MLTSAGSCTHAEQCMRSIDSREETVQAPQIGEASGISLYL